MEDYLTFIIDDDLYGINLLCIEEIITLKKVAKLPGLPEYVLGVINLRGMIIPVIDFRILIGIKPRPFDNHTVIIIVEFNKKVIGILVDTVCDIFYSTEDLSMPPEFSGNIKTDYIKGLAQKHEDSNEMVIVIDLEKLLDTEALLNLKIA